MKMFIQDLYNENGEWKPLRPNVFSMETGYANAKEGQRELLRRWAGRGVTRYKNGIEFPNSPVHGMKQLVWFEERA